MSFLFGRIDARRYAALRIAFGLLALLSLAGLWREAVFQYSDSGWLPLPIARLVIGPDDWSILYWISGAVGVRLFFAFALAAAAAMTIGFQARLSTWLTFAAVVSIQSRNCLNTYGGDAVLRLMLFLLALSPCGSAWSVDSLRSREEGGPAKAPAWPLFLMQAQICLIYFSSGWTKLHGQTWLDGTALGLVLLNPIFARADYGFIRTSAGAANALKTVTRLVLAWEIGFPFLMISRKTRWPALAFGACMHLGIIILIQLHWFGQLMLASYLAFVPEGWFAAAEEAAVAGFSRLPFRAQASRLIERAGRRLSSAWRWSGRGA